MINKSVFGVCLQGGTIVKAPLSLVHPVVHIKLCSSKVSHVCDQDNAA